jgi:hypothetical protein
VKLNVAALEVPALVTATDDPAAPVVTVPTDMVAAVPVGPVGPVGPVAPVCNVKSKIAALLVPELDTAAVPAVTVPTVIVAAVPVDPVGPVGPVGPVAPVSPLGIVKLNVAADVVPEFVIATEDPALPVVTVPNVKLAAAPVGPIPPEL